MASDRDQYRDWLIANLKKQGRGARVALAEFLGVRPDAITRMATEDPSKEPREITAVELKKMEEFFRAIAPRVQPDQSAPFRAVPVVGRIGAGAEIMPEFEQLPPEGLFEIETQLPMPEGAVAFVVEGTSMWPACDPGDVIVCHGGGSPIGSVVGFRAAVRTRDGRRFLKRVIQTETAGRYDLESINAETIRNVQLEWVSEIIATFPASQWRKLERATIKRAFKKAATRQP